MIAPSGNDVRNVPTIRDERSPNESSIVWQLANFTVFLGSDKAGIRQRSNEEITLESFDRAGPMRHQARDSGRLNQNAGKTIAPLLPFGKSVLEAAPPQ